MCRSATASLVARMVNTNLEAQKLDWDKSESLTKWKIIRNASKSSKCVWKYILSPPLIITTQHCQWCIGVNIKFYTTIENPPYFFMTLSCMEAIQSFINHFKQYSLVNPSWGNIPSWVWQGVNHWFRKLWCQVWHHCHFGNWISWK